MNSHKGYGKVEYCLPKSEKESESKDSFIAIVDSVNLFDVDIQIWLKILICFPHPQNQNDYMSLSDDCLRLSFKFKLGISAPSIRPRIIEALGKTMG